MMERPAPRGTQVDQVDADELSVSADRGEPANAGSSDLWIEDSEPASTAAAGDALPDTRLVSDEQREALHVRWREIQAMFVDEPRGAVNQADALVGEVVDAVTSGFASRKAGLEQRWGAGGEVATEDLRQALQAYRAFFQRLLQI
jgi:hypothetical protein